MTGLHGDAGWRSYQAGAAALFVGSRPMSEWTHLERDVAGHFATSLREDQIRARKRSFWSWYKQRRADIEAVIRLRIAPDETIPETDDAIDLIRVMAYHLQAIHGPENLLPALDEWCREMAPWARYGVSDTILYVMHDVEGRRRDLTAFRAGHELALTWDERCRLGVRTMRPVDLTSAEFRARVKDRKREADRQRDERRRRQSGAPERRDWLEANSASRDEPWAAMGISRRTYYRRLAAARDAAENDVADRGTGPSQLGEAYTTAEGPVPSAAADEIDGVEALAVYGLGIAVPTHPATNHLRGGSASLRRLIQGVRLRGCTALDDTLKPLMVANHGCLGTRSAA